MSFEQTASTRKPGDPLSVTAALLLAKASLESINVSIVGEVSELQDKPGYKAVYFSLSDESSALPCMIWRNNYQKGDVELHQGMLVQATGRFTLYAAKGRMNFEVRSLTTVGEGDLRVKVAALARKLADEGLMDASRKRPTPRLPERIGVVTSPRGKAVHDVLRTLRRRWPLAEVLLAGVAVEGETAVAQMIEGLSALVAARPDVILLVRGGGSYEDLMPFNDERLARAVAASPIPVVTGIGHEPDTSIADMVADFRASTPTAAAEHVSPDQAELTSWLTSATKRIDNSLLGFIRRLRDNLHRQANHALFTDDSRLMSSRWLELERNQQRLTAAAEKVVTSHSATLGRLAAQLEALSPLAVMSRGYALVTDSDKHLIRSVADVKAEDLLTVHLSDGKVGAQVTQIDQ